MKKIILLLVCLVCFIGEADAVVYRTYSNAYSPYTRSNVGYSSNRPRIRTYNPNSYYNTGNCDHNHGNYNNYNNYNNSYRNPYAYRNSSGYRRSSNYNRYYRQPVNNTGNVIYRHYGSDSNTTNIKPISFNNENNLHYERITQIEQSIWGQTYEDQNINLRLNRLEKTVFNRTYPKMPYEQRVNNIIVNYNSTLPKSVSTNNLAKIEERVFNRSYSSDNEESRIARLEEEVLGARQKGDLKTRYDTIKRATSSYTSNMNSCPYGRPLITSGNGWKGAAGTLSNFFFGGNGYYPGSATGWSPQMDPAYMDCFDAERNSNSQDWVSNRGYYHNTSQSGSRTGVTILD